MSTIEVRMSTPLLQRTAPQNRSICSTVVFAGSTLLGLAATGLTTYTLLDGEENGFLGIPEYLALGASVACTIAGAIGFWKSRSVIPVDNSMSDQMQRSSQTSGKIWESLMKISGDLDDISRHMDSKTTSSNQSLVDIEMGIVSEGQIYSKVSELQSKLAQLKTSAQSAKTQLGQREQLEQEVAQLRQQVAKGSVQKEQLEQEVARLMRLVQDYKDAQQKQGATGGLDALTQLNRKLQSAHYSDSDTDSVFSSPESAERKDVTPASKGNLTPKKLDFDSPSPVGNNLSANADT